jgi:hypothetical protein
MHCSQRFVCSAAKSVRSEILSQIFLRARIPHANPFYAELRFFVIGLFFAKKNAAICRALVFLNRFID